MKIDCEVIAVETQGDTLRVTLQGMPPAAAEWRGRERQMIIIPTSQRAERTFHVGRRVMLDIAAR